MAALLRKTWRRAMGAKKVAVGSTSVALFILVAIFGPMVYRTNPSTVSAAVLQAPSRHHLLGTTQLGQDVLAQLIVGSRTTLAVSFGAGAVASLVAVVVGLLSGYAGGITDELLSTVTNMFLVIPGLPLVIVLAGYLPARGAMPVALVIAATGWSWGARGLRAQTLSLRKRDFVEAARATGERPLRLIFEEILPNEAAIIYANFLFTVIYAVLAESSLAFLGLTNLSSWSWGGMLYWAQGASALQAGAWWWFVPPGLAIALLGTSLALINFGIDEIVNPRLRLPKATAARRKFRGLGGVLPYVEQDAR